MCPQAPSAATAAPVMKPASSPTKNATVPPSSAAVQKRPLGALPAWLFAFRVTTTGPEPTVEFDRPGKHGIDADTGRGIFYVTDHLRCQYLSGAGVRGQQ
jgi:hypothetical protein